MCVHIAGGKKNSVRYSKCRCPTGWRNSDKCVSPNDDHIAPCYLSHPLNRTKFEEINFQTEVVKLGVKQVIFYVCLNIFEGCDYFDEINFL